MQPRLRVEILARVAQVEGQRLAVAVGVGLRGVLAEGAGFQRPAPDGAVVAGATQGAWGAEVVGVGVEQFTGVGTAGGFDLHADQLIVQPQQALFGFQGAGQADSRDVAGLDQASGFVVEKAQCRHARHHGFLFAFASGVVAGGVERGASAADLAQAVAAVVAVVEAVAPGGVADVVVVAADAVDALQAVAGRRIGTALRCAAEVGGGSVAVGVVVEVFQHAAALAQVDETIQRVIAERVALPAADQAGEVADTVERGVQVECRAIDRTKPDLVTPSRLPSITPSVAQSSARAFASAISISCRRPLSASSRPGRGAACSAFSNFSMAPA